VSEFESTAKVATEVAPVLLDYRQAAKALRIGQRTLADLVAKGEIPVVRIRGRVLFCPDTLAAWAKSHEGSTPSEGDAS
jgi:excisionase family DNA binding protein